MRADRTTGRIAAFKLSLATRRLLQKAGYFKGLDGRESAYTFEERLLLCEVAALRAARVPAREISQALRKLKGWPGIRKTLVHIVLATQRGARLCDGQYALPLETPMFEANVIPIRSAEKSMKKKHTASHGHYLRGAELEREDVKAARAAYESCLAGDCRHLEARINLGRLLHVEGLLLEAEKIYNGHEEPNAVLYFNLGVLLEDLKRELDAVAAYRLAIVHDPGMADAHFNLSLIHERLGEAQAAFRHLLAYRRLIEAHGAAPEN